MRAPNSNEPGLLMMDWQEPEVLAPEEEAELQPELERMKVVNWALRVFREGPEAMRSMARYAALQVAHEWTTAGEEIADGDPYAAVLKWAEVLVIYEAIGELERGAEVYACALEAWSRTPGAEGKALTLAVGGFEGIEQMMRAQPDEHAI